ncbi:hypothetical protein BGZ51_008158 [Haplosporangium sp. Z 767]|nr:hypothetical protein BGZ50_007288 [Haplosporangium sp. Z 11]KAF9190873.1 hypothetical protein BGZ51_008158 [Haplosporangium sp. Z 767]
MPRNQATSPLHKWYIPAIGEFCGTAMFLFLAVGGSDSSGQGVPEGMASLGVAFAFGMGLLTTAWALARVSGSMFNPAITLSCLIVGSLSIPKAILYFICQILGGCVGVAMARGTTPSSENVGQFNSLHNGETLARGFFLEFWLTFILCFVYLMTTEERNKSAFMAPLPIGIAIFSCHLFGTRYTYTSINPARAFATSLVSRNFTYDHWIYWIGPFGGGIVAAALYIFFCYFGFDTVPPVYKARSRTGVADSHRETGNANDSSASTTAYGRIYVESTGDNPSMSRRA